MAGLISFFGGRAFAWLILGGGGLLAITALWSSAKHKGAIAEAGKWKTAIIEQVKDNRDANHRVDMGTMAETGSLNEQEQAIRQKWKTMGRAPTQAKE